MSQRILSRKSLLLISIIVIVLDQLSKYWARGTLSPGISKALIPSIIQLRLVKNTGAAFSLFSGATTLLALISLLVSVGLFIWIIQKSTMNIWQGTAFAFLLGGSIGNGLDRWFFGKVTDFLELIPINFPIFNLADIAINFAVISFIIDTLSNRRRKNHL